MTVYLWVSLIWNLLLTLGAMSNLRKQSDASQMIAGCLFMFFFVWSAVLLF